MKIKPINPDLKPLLEEFLSSEKYKPKFIEQARLLGYVGDDPVKIRVSLFIPREDGEICFASKIVEDLFVEFQIIKALIEVGIPEDLEPDIMKQLIDECREKLYDLHKETK